MKEYIYFEIVEKKPKTNVYLVRAKSDGCILGKIYWHFPWRQYIFESKDLILWSKGCLLEVMNFLKNLMDKRKQKLNIILESGLNEGR